jgi:hypothetical protein
MLVSSVESVFPPQYVSTCTPTTAATSIAARERRDVPSRPRDLFMGPEHHRLSTVATHVALREGTERFR